MTVWITPSTRSAYPSAKSEHAQASQQTSDLHTHAPDVRIQPAQFASFGQSTAYFAYVSCHYFCGVTGRAPAFSHLNAAQHSGWRSARRVCGIRPSVAVYILFARWHRSHTAAAVAVWFRPRRRVRTPLYCTVMQLCACRVVLTVELRRCEPTSPDPRAALELCGVGCSVYRAVSRRRAVPRGALVIFRDGDPGLRWGWAPGRIPITVYSRKEKLIFFKTHANVGFVARRQSVLGLNAALDGYRESADREGTTVTAMRDFTTRGRGIIIPSCETICKPICFAFALAACHADFLPFRPSAMPMVACPYGSFCESFGHSRYIWVKKIGRLRGSRTRGVEGARMRHQRPCRRPLKAREGCSGLVGDACARQLDGGVDGRRPPYPRR